MIVMIHLILILMIHFILIRESEETERRTSEEMEEKRREISELSSDLAAARLIFLSLSNNFHWTFSHYNPTECEDKLTERFLGGNNNLRKAPVNWGKFSLLRFEHL